MGSGRIIKLSENMRPFVARAVRSGKVQVAFAKQIGIPVGACVASGVKKGMSRKAIRDVVAKCGKAKRGVKLAL